VRPANELLLNLTGMINNTRCHLARINAYGDDEDLGSADVRVSIHDADGHANAVHRADRWGYGHADDARHASEDVRDPTIRDRANGSVVRSDGARCQTPSEHQRTRIGRMAARVRSPMIGRRQ
jgi:hypothetical protein